jgi:hypothetical protein
LEAVVGLVRLLEERQAVLEVVADINRPQLEQEHQDKVTLVAQVLILPLVRVVVAGVVPGL